MLFTISGCSDLRKDKETIREMYLQKIPLGSAYTEVKIKLKSKFDENYISYQERYQCYINDNWVDARKIVVYLGWYLDVFLPVDTYISWCFDSDDKLIELTVSKEVDSI